MKCFIIKTETMKKRIRLGELQYNKYLNCGLHYALVFLKTFEFVENCL